MKKAAIKAIEKLAEKDESIIVLSGDLGYGILDSFIEKFPDRYFNAGICEQSMASIAAGLAMEGKKVYIYSIANFPTLRCLEQIRNDICYHNADVKIIAVGGGFSYGALGMSHHATEDYSIMRSLPNMRVYSPIDPVTAKKTIYETYSILKPCYIRINKGGEENFFDFDDQITIDEPSTLVNGNQAAVFVTGAITCEAVKAVTRLNKAGYSIACYSFSCIKPMNERRVSALAEKYSVIFTIEENNKYGGFGSAIAEIVSQMSGVKSIIQILGIEDTYTEIIGTQEYLRDIYGLSSNKIQARIMTYFLE